MRIKMLSRSAAPDGTAEPGDVVDRSPERARQLVKAGFARHVDEPEPEPRARRSPPRNRGKRQPQNEESGDSGADGE